MSCYLYKSTLSPTISQISKQEAPSLMESQDSCFPGDSNGGDTGLTSLPSDIISSHILTKLDGQSLASTSCSSPQLHKLSSEQYLWRNICNSTFPSTADPLVRNTIYNFPSGHRSFFSDTFPTLHHHQRQYSESKIKKKVAEETPELISAVDVHFRGYSAYSKVVITESQTSWFASSPLRIDIVGPKDPFPIPANFVEDESDQVMKTLEEEIKLSWIIIDPRINRAVNLSSHVPVEVRRNCFTGYIEVRYVTVAAAAGVEGGVVSYVATVTCGGGKEGRELHVREISMQVENMEGKIMNGKDSLVILHEAMEGRRRTKMEICEMNKRYENFKEMRRLWRDNKEKREKRIDMVCMASGLIIFIAFWSLIFFS